MNRQFWKELFTKLESASDEELKEMREYLLTLRAELKGSEIMPDIRRALKLVDEEIVTRKNLFRVVARS